MAPPAPLLALRCRHTSEVCAPARGSGRVRLGVAGDGEEQVTLPKRPGSMDEYPLLACQCASTPISTARRSALIGAGSWRPSRLGRVVSIAKTLNDDGQTVAALVVAGPAESMERAYE
jgi:hypothetical protein